MKAQKSIPPSDLEAVIAFPLTHDNLAAVRYLEKHSVCNLYDEKHFTVGQLSKLWGLSDDVIRSWFREEPGVLFQGTTESRISGRKMVNRHVRMSIPASVAEKVYNRHTFASH